MRFDPELCGWYFYLLCVWEGEIIIWGKGMLYGVKEAREGLARDLASAGIEPGMILLVHSSLRSMGHLPGGAETVIHGLFDALGADGTLLMPALSYQYVTLATPMFDIRRTPSNVGVIPETFRLMRGVIRSVNPTHSVCGIGKHAPGMLDEHHLDDTPCGAHSPFHKLRDAGGFILFLGCGLKPNTSMHAIEEIVEPPYLFGDMIDYTVTLADGNMLRTRNRRHDFCGWEQRYDRVESLLQGRGLIHGRVMEATSHLVDARLLWECALGALRKNQFYFVDPVSM